MEITDKREFSKILTGKCNQRAIIVPPKGKIKIQSHHDTEIWVVQSGKGILFSAGQHAEIQANQMAIFSPFDYHYLENPYASEIIITAFWFVDWNHVHQKIASLLSNRSQNNILIGSAFPTPNGPLHIGHLAGTYLLSLITKKCYELQDTVTFSYCGTFGNLNHLNRTASAKSILLSELISSSEQQIQNDLKIFGAEFDDFLPHAPTNNELFSTTIKMFVDEVLKLKSIEIKEVNYPYSTNSSEFVSESYVSGNCPNCDCITIGIECEHCGLYQDEVNLLNPFHSDTKELLIKRPVKRLYLNLTEEALNQIMVGFFIENSMRSMICYELFKQYLGKNLLKSIPISNFRDKGIVVFENQRLSMPFERALRSYYNLMKFSDIDRHIFFCGIDNLCASGIIMPAILKMMGIENHKLPIVIVNQFFNLDGKKLSTSKNHTIDAKFFLEKYPEDLIRLHFSHINNSSNHSNFSMHDFLNFSCSFVDRLLNIFNIFIQLASDSKLDIIEAGPWIVEDIIFYKKNNDYLSNCINLFLSRATQLAVNEIESSITTITFYCSQSLDIARLGDINRVRTRLALLIHSFKCLTFMLYPVMTHLAKTLMHALNISITDYIHDNVTVTINRQIHFSQILKILNDYKLELFL